MARVWDAVVIGAGHNGLVAATCLARAGLSTLVLERRDGVGGAAVTEEIHPGFRCPTVAHAAGPLLPAVLRQLHLERHGLALLRPEVRLLALDGSGRALRVYDDPARTARAGGLGPREAERYVELLTVLRRLGAVLRPLLGRPPPAVDRLAPGELLGLLGVARRYRCLPRRDRYRLLRWPPMPVADLVREWFDDALLQAAVAARGVWGGALGPMAPGTGLGLLLQAALDGQATLPAAFVRGGPGALSEALRTAAQQAGAEVRTGAEVMRIAVLGGAARGVVLRGGEEIASRVVVSACDPRRTFLGLIDPAELDPAFVGRVQAYRCSGSAAKVNLALAALPAVPALAGSAEGAARLLSGRLHIGPDLEYLERAADAAKYGEMSPRPLLDVTIPSLLDDSLAPRGAHVMSVYLQWAPYRLRRGDWPSRRQELGEIVLSALQDCFPNLRSLVVACQVLTPHDLEDTYALTGGHPFHGEGGLDQFLFRPLLGATRYRGPIAGLYLCSAGTHPGGGVTGAPGLNASREILRDLR
ncbi:MAG: NAD(P)/FAD-dependent oxidoreductase [Myxococcales bacterium]|nr:NAD(P)/FAD-dependent oxidoreductase [Myxococcota bacterium]MDW8282136.1 NAD(P)/FAD-dependent oxidoreductase [Myxococcales bacterium]